MLECSGMTTSAYYVYYNNPATEVSTTGISNQVFVFFLES